MPPRIVIAAAGSLGDLHPFIALGQALKARGFQVEIATNIDYGPKVEAEGLVFREVGLSFDAFCADLGMTMAQLTEAIARSERFLFQRAILPYLENASRQLIDTSVGASAIVGPILTTSAAIAAEALDLPFVSVALQPAVLVSAYDPPVTPKAPWMAPAEGGFGLWLNRTTLGLARLTTTADLTRPLNAVRARLGLAETRCDILFDAGAGAALNLGLYSPLLGGTPPDAPPGFAVTGYAAYDSEAGGVAVMPPGLQAFLDDGQAPIVFTLGSAAVHIPGGFYAESLKAARRLGHRAVLLVGPEGDLSVADGPDAIAAPYAPYSLLFPHAAAIAHQGGVGTTQQALRAGRPQLVVPHLGDQFDNAARVVRLGCGATLSRKHYRFERVTAVLDRLLSDTSFNLRAEALGQTASLEDGAAVAADRIAALVG